MEFSPNNPVVKLCLQGMALEDNGKQSEAIEFFQQAWKEATNNQEKFLAAHYIARQQQNAADKLKWLQNALHHANAANDESVKSAFPALYTNLAKCYEALDDVENAREHFKLANEFQSKPSDKGPFYHGTKADLNVGDFLKPGFNSNYQSDLVMNHIYFTALVNGAGLAAALANGEGRERVYIVAPTGPFENDPNVTDKKFPGNPTRSYRTQAPLKIIGEAKDWVRTSPEQVKMWREKLAANKGEIIN